MSQIRKHINLVENIQNIQEATYSVVKGDNLTKIAKRSGISLKNLLDLNPDLKANPNLIQIGQKIRVPGQATTTKAPTPKIASPSMTAVSPQKGIGIKAFAKQLGYDNVEEFIAAQEAGGGKIGTMKSGKYAGNNFVYTNQQYIPKAKAEPAPVAGIQKQMTKPQTDTMQDIEDKMADVAKAASYKPDNKTATKSDMVKIGDIMATPDEIAKAKAINPNSNNPLMAPTDADYAKDIKAARRLGR